MSFIRISTICMLFGCNSHEHHTLVLIGCQIHWVHSHDIDVTRHAQLSFGFGRVTLFFAHFQCICPALRHALFCPLSDRATIEIFSDLSTSPLSRMTYFFFTYEAVGNNMQMCVQKLSSVFFVLSQWKCSSSKQIKMCTRSSLSYLLEFKEVTTVASGRKEHLHVLERVSDKAQGGTSIYIPQGTPWQAYGCSRKFRHW